MADITFFMFNTEKDDLPIRTASTFGNISLESKMKILKAIVVFEM